MFKMLLLPPGGEQRCQSRLCYNPSTMALTLEEVRHIARLARLKLSEAEERQYREQLSAVLEHAARLRSVDTSDVPPTATVVPVQAKLRVDSARPGLSQAEVLANAPQVEGGMFQVPPVLDSAG